MKPTIEIIKEQFHLRLFEESVNRIEKVLDLLSEDEVWYSPNNSMNSIGNLILHLCGNVQQWICTGIGKREDIRIRNQEFIENRTYKKQELIKKLRTLEEITKPVIDSLEEKNLNEERIIQGFEETVLSIIIHVMEHFSYHTGQIALIAKLLKNQDLKFYEGMDLSITN